MAARTKAERPLFILAKSPRNADSFLSMSDTCPLVCTATPLPGNGKAFFCASNVLIALLI